MRYWLVMPAAGVGSRFGKNVPKQYAELHGRTVMEWSLATFLYDSRCEGVVVVTSANDAHWTLVASRLPDVSVATRATEPTVAAALADATRAAELEPNGSSLEPAPQTAEAVRLPQVITTAGGRDRSESVRNGLAALADRAAPDDWVLVHDAARPCVSRQDVDRLLEIVRVHPVGGLLATPAADTLKRAGADLEIEATVDRTSLWRALTPQMFRYQKLCAALDRAFAEGRSPTDEAQALEWSGERPLVVEGSTTNIKITSADDLVIAAALMDKRGAHPKGET